MNREIERLENAIRHINRSLDVDEWAKTEAVAAMRYRIGMLTGGKNEQQGKWIFAGDCYKCSECGTVYGWWADSLTSKYCPNCGARMQKDGDEE